MSIISFLGLGAVLTFVLVLVVSLLGAVAARLGANWPPKNPGARTQFTVLMMLVVITAGFWIAWQIVM